MTHTDAASGPTLLADSIPSDTPTPDVSGTVVAQQTVDAAVQQTATVAAQQTVDAATQQTATAIAQQTVDAATQQAATAEAQQTSDAATAEAQQTATAEAQQTATAEAQQTADAATAEAQQTATAEAQQTATSIALATNIAGTLASKQAIISARQTSIAQATIAAHQTATTIVQQTATAASQQTATAIAQQTATAASQQTAVAASQQTAVAQQAAAAAAIAAASTAAAQQTAVAQQHVALPSTPGGTKQTNTGTSGSGASVAPTPTDIVVVVSDARSYQSTTLQPTSIPTVTAPRPANPTPPVLTSPAPSTIPGRTSTVRPSPRPVYTGNRPPSPPHLTVSVLSPLVKPGALQQIRVSYVEGALVQTRAIFPHTQPVMLYSLTDAHGRLDTAVRVPLDVSLLNGRATGSISIHAVSGPWRQLKQFPLLLQTGATARMTITYRPSVYMRANIQFSGTVSRSLLDKTDIHGHVAFLVQVPANVAVNGKRVTAHVTMWALSDTRHADATVSTIVSDMVLVADHSAIRNCIQVHTFHVSYAPHVPVKLRLTFPHHYHLLLGATTDRQGNATMHVKVLYKRSHNPVLFGAQAYDARFGKQRSEHITVTASLPSACQS